jgi:hypothetical protein
MLLNKDCFSSGQITSKLWLCKKLEDLNWESDNTAIYGGWQGMLAFLLLSRGKFKVKKIRSYDIDPKCEPIADAMNENWVINNWQFKAFTKDCNLIIPDSDLIINTATEHFDSDRWFQNIPSGTRLILQSNNMKRDDHNNTVDNLDQFKERYRLNDVLLAEKINFRYPTWFFDRFMLIGIK